MLKNNRGMTLIEIMIVLAIVGGLMAILAKNFGSQLAKSRVKQTQIEMGTIINALNMYQTDCGRLPSNLEALVKSPGGEECSNWGPDPYLKKAPKDAWGTDYIYTVEGSTFSLKSLGADRREGGDSFDKDLTSEEL